MKKLSLFAVSILSIAILLSLSGCGGSNPAGGGGGTGGGTGGATALTAPTLSATATSSSSINLSWNAVSGATSYNVWAVPAIYLPPGMNIALSLVASTSATGYTVNGLAANKAYTYYVNAVSATTGSPNSASASATTLTGGPVPAIPTGLTALPGVTQISLSWNAVPGATSYTVARWMAVFAPNPAEVPIATVTGTSYVDTGLTSGWPQTYYIKANNDNGSSAYCAGVNATTFIIVVWVPPAGVLPAAPTGVSGTVINPGQITLSWAAVSGATSYNVYDSLGANTVTISPATKLGNTTGTSMQHIGLTAGNTYSYIVTAVNANGESVGSIVTNVAIQVGSIAKPTIVANAIQSFDSYAFPYYEDRISITAPAGTYRVNIYYRTNPVTDPFPVYALDTGITSIPFYGAPYNSGGYYVLVGPDPINWGNILAQSTSTMSFQKHIVMTTIDPTGKESAFSNEIWYHY